LQAARFTEAGRSLRVSVNLSARQFQQSDLPKSVEQALRVSGVSPELLDIEITETTLVNIKQSRETLRRLKDLGVRLSVDDFGIGYSSLSYLRTLPLDVLKIDRLFVNDLGQDHKGESVVLRLVELAHDLGLEVIAEGVENEAQRSRLQRMGCDAMQGYLFSPPTTAADVIGLVENAERSHSSNVLPLVAASSDISLSPLIAALSNSPVTEQASEALPTRVATVSTTGKPTKTARSKSGRTRADVAQGVEEAVLVLSRGRWKDGSG
jgi:EAL domain-containing protein (putative c-di-GMP-specific phosphodiesterase class I)